MAKIKSDENGVYVVADGKLARPGLSPEYEGIFDMSAKGLHIGMIISAKHIKGTNLVRLDAPKKFLYWKIQ